MLFFSPFTELLETLCVDIGSLESAKLWPWRESLKKRERKNNTESEWSCNLLITVRLLIYFTHTHIKGRVCSAVRAGRYWEVIDRQHELTARA